MLERIGQIACISAFIAAPFVVLTFLSGTALGIDTSFNRIAAWLLCMWTYLGYIPGHLLHFGFQNDYVSEQYKIPTAIGITAASLILYVVGMTMMVFYLKDFVLAGIAFLAVGYRIFMAVGFKKPYFDKPKELVCEAIHDVLIMASFAFVGIKTASPLWVAGAVGWLVYLLLNQYHGRLILERGRGYVLVVISVFFGSGLLPLLLALKWDPNAFPGFYPLFGASSLGIAVAFMARLFAEIREAPDSYKFSLLLLPLSVVFIILAYLSSNHFVVDIAKLVPLIEEALHWESVFALSAFLGCVILLFFVMFQAVFLKSPSELEGNNY